MKFAAVLFALTWKSLVATQPGVKVSDIEALLDDYSKYRNEINNMISRETIEAVNLTHIEKDGASLDMLFITEETTFRDLHIDSKSFDLRENELEGNASLTLWSDTAKGQLIIQGTLNGTKVNETGNFLNDHNKKNIYLKFQFDENSVKLVDYKVTSLPMDLQINIEEFELNRFNDLKEDFRERMRHVVSRHTKPLEEKEDKELNELLSSVNEKIEGKTLQQAYKQLREWIDSKPKLVQI